MRGGRSEPARGARVPALRLRAAAEVDAAASVPACAQVGARSAASAARAADCRRSPRARVRAALRRPKATTRCCAASSTHQAPWRWGRRPHGTGDLIQRFQTLLDAIHDSPDEAAALQVIAGGPAAASTAARWSFGRPARRQGRGRGTAVAGEEALTQPCLDGGCSVFRDGLTPEAAEAGPRRRERARVDRRALGSRRQAAGRRARGTCCASRRPRPRRC